MNPTLTVPVRDTPETSGIGLSEASLIDGPVEPRHSLLSYLQLFWASRHFLLRAAICSVLASAVVAILVPARYQSVTRLMPPDGQSGPGLGIIAALAGRASGASGMAGMEGVAGDLLGTKSSGALFVGILNSETVQDALIDRFQLQNLYRDSKIEDARNDLADHSNASEDRKSGIISIAVWDHDPKRAAAMAQAYVAELDRMVAQVSTSSARRERIFLEGRIKNVKEDLDAAARNFSDFASRNTAIDIPAQGKAMVEAAAILQGQLIAAQSELSGLQQIYTGNNVRVRAAEARIKELQDKLNEVGGAGTHDEVESNHSLYPSIRKLPLLGVTYADLYRQTKIQETVYELLTEQYELAKVREAKEIPTVKVLDQAIVPTKRSFPPRAAIVVLGTMLGIAFGMTWVVGKTRWDAVDANDPRKEFAFEVFESVQAGILRFRQNRTAAGSNVRPRWRLWKGSRNVNRDSREVLGENRSNRTGDGDGDMRA